MGHKNRWNGETAEPVDAVASGLVVSRAEHSHSRNVRAADRRFPQVSVGITLPTLRTPDAIPTIWTHRTADARLFLRRDALPTQVARCAVGEVPAKNQANLRRRSDARWSWESTISRRLVATGPVNGNSAMSCRSSHVTRSSSRPRSSRRRIRTIRPTFPRVARPTATGLRRSAGHPRNQQPRELW